jgi:cyclase
MLSKRIIPCLDVKNGKTTKGIKFRNNLDVGDPVEMGKYYYEEGADEIVFYDITASNERRGIILDMVRRVAEQIFIPFSVGGGIRTLADMRDVLLGGAEKVSINSAAVRNPQLIAEGARAFGSQCIVLGIDAKRVEESKEIPSGYEIFIDGGRLPTGIDARNWAKEAEGLGAGEICLNSIDMDGTKSGYDVKLTRMISESVNIPIIASGGAGKIDHIYEALTKGKANAALVASIVHYREYSIKEIKEELDKRGVKVRLQW